MIAARNLIAAGALVAGTLFAAQALAQSAPAPAAAQQRATPESVFANWDKDNNKSISMDEFRTGWQEVQGAMAVRKLRANFNALDVNKSGGLEAAEYANLAMVKKAGNTAPMLSFYDLDKNQKLDFKEYLAMVNAMGKRK